MSPLAEGAARFGEGDGLKVCIQEWSCKNERGPHHRGSHHLWKVPGLLSLTKWKKNYVQAQSHPFHHYFFTSSVIKSCHLNSGMSLVHIKSNSIPHRRSNRLGTKPTFLSPLQHPGQIMSYCLQVPHGLNREVFSRCQDGMELLMWHPMYLDFGKKVAGGLIDTRLG